MDTKFDSNTSVLPIINVGMYDSVLSPENVFDSDFEDCGDVPAYKDEDWDRFDGGEYKKFVGNKAASIVDEVANEHLVGNGYGIKAVTSDGSIWSPRYYNFATDQLNMKIEVEDGFIDIALSNLEKWKGNKEVEKWIKDHYTSYDGFTSFVPNSIDDIEDELKNGPSQSLMVSVYATLCLVERGYFRVDGYSKESEYDYSNTKLLEEVSGNSGFGDFLVEAA